MGETAMPEIDKTLCTLCGYCVVACPAGALSLLEEGIHLEKGLCAYCGDCEAVCPNGAISLPYEIRLHNAKTAGSLGEPPAATHGTL
ncbi:MAG: 4Fe-4S binding protein [Chloroflexi bacterium]|nr:4Fe-4S binding protein [Chloroflexota bacterium]